MNPEVHDFPKGCRSWSFSHTNTKVEVSHLNYLTSIRDSAESGLGRMDNRHLNYFAESIFVNMGDSQQNLKEGSPPMNVVRVGATIIVGDRENLLHGEGLQFVGIF